MVQHVIKVALRGFAAFLIAALVSPADPISMVLATVPIFLLALFAYWLGLRSGRKRGSKANE